MTLPESFQAKTAREGARWPVSHPLPFHRIDAATSTAALPDARPDTLWPIAAPTGVEPRLPARRSPGSRACTIPAGMTPAARQRLEPPRDDRFPAEQARILALLLERVDIGTEGLNVRLRVDGLGGLAREMLAGVVEAAA